MDNSQFQPESKLESTSLLSYYQDNRINPVPIPLVDGAAWEIHVAKRTNLYERHLGVSLSLLADRSVLEIGCNSGENALVLAAMGANVTLVEPNPLAIEPLLNLFSRFNLRDRIVGVHQDSIEVFETHATFDIVVAEGFLSALEHRDQMLSKVCRLVAPGGFAVVSFNDRIGHLLEVVRKLLFWRIIRIEGLTDFPNVESLGIARRLYLDDFNRLNASRPFQAWYEDVLLNPYILFDYLWSYREILPLIEQENCEFHSSSPNWSSVDRFSWYKNVLNSVERHQRVLDEVQEFFSYFITGISPLAGDVNAASPEVVAAAQDLTARISDYIQTPDANISSVFYPEELDDYLSKSSDPRLREFNTELKNLHTAVRSTDIADIVGAYQETEHLRNLWGAPYHYLSVKKQG